MILAAGLGTRLRPVTETLPKPLVPVVDRPLLENVIRNLETAGVTDLAVNTHHLPDRIAAFVAGRKGSGRIEVFHEPEILGTGGALVNARGFLSAGEYFLLHNGDVLADLDLAELVGEHQRHCPLATLVLTVGHENRVLAAPDGVVLDILGKVGAGKGQSGRLLTYTGIAALSPRIFEYLPPEGPSSLPAALIEAIRAEPGCVRALRPGGLYWNDVGTLQRYLEANRDALEGRVSLPPAAGGPGLEPLVEQGSDRQFFRMQAGGASYVLMFSPPGDPDNQRYVEIGRFLGERDLGAPQLLAAVADSSSAVLEDLGDGRLYDLALAAGGEQSLKELYSPVVSFLARLAARGTAGIEACPAAASRALDYEQLRWETDYFRDRCLVGLLGMSRKETDALDGEFEALAREVEKQPRVFMHRDFQSQNIMIRDGRVRIVDFQGARRGPLAYDLASLLKDPYVCLPHRLRRELAELYRTELAALGGPEVSGPDLHRYLLLAGLQRNMQALGAYGFLSRVKGKSGFEAFLAPGFERLREGLAELAGTGGLPAGMPLLTRVCAGATY